MATITSKTGHLCLTKLSLQPPPFVNHMVSGVDVDCSTHQGSRFLNLSFLIISTGRNKVPFTQILSDFGPASVHTP